MSNSPGVVEICSIRFDSHLGISAFWCQGLHNTRVNEHGVCITCLYLHSGVVGVHTTRFD